MAVEKCRDEPAFSAAIFYSVDGHVAIKDSSYKMGESNREMDSLNFTTFERLS